MRYKLPLRAVSLIEVMVAIMIFFLGLISVYSVISSTLQVNDYNKNFIIASNLARERIEIIKNIRDYNFRDIAAWDRISSDNAKVWERGQYYVIENAFTGDYFVDAIIDTIDSFAIGEDELAGKMQQYRLCLSESGRYTYDCVGSEQTPFYAYVYVDEVSYVDDGGATTIIPNALKFSAGVIWYQGGYHETEISTILTDWQRL